MHHIQTSADGSFYEGELLDGYKHGYGSILYPDGSRYEGHFSHNLRHGTGSFWEPGRYHIKLFDGPWINDFPLNFTPAAMHQEIFNLYSKLDSIPMSLLLNVTPTYAPCNFTGDDSLDVGRALMPCSHAISRDAMRLFLQTEILGNKRSSSLMCPLCSAPWDFMLCELIALPDIQLSDSLRLQLSENLISTSNNLFTCPTCSSYFEHHPSPLVSCPHPSCSHMTPFCTLCLRYPNSSICTLCSNPSDRQSILNNSPFIPHDDPHGRV